MTPERSGVLVIITGGNVGLVATTDKRHNPVLEPVHVPELKRIVLGNVNASTLLLREGNLAGTTVSVDFNDLREFNDPELRGRKQRYYDPEELDSAQVDPTLWSSLAQSIYDVYPKYEGFVVLHGLDTMAYTASALAFMLRNLRIPIIITGSQRPLNYPRTDALQNIYSAITLAASKSLGIRPMIPEVCVYSYDTLFRGSRVSMVNASSYRAFDSPNFPPLGTVGEHIDIQAHLVRNEPGSGMVNLRAKAAAKVVILDVFPGMDAAVISSLAAARSENPVRGMLLRTYGMGSAPTSPDVLSALEELTSNRIVVMNVTQARSGRISHSGDPVSLRLFEQGVVSGVDMSAEAAYAKMVVLLSEQDDADKVADLLQIETCGEQSLSIFNIHYAPGRTEEPAGEAKDTACRATLRPRKDVVEKSLLKLQNIKHIQLRLLGVEPVHKSDGTAINRTIDVDVALIDMAADRKTDAHHLQTDILRWSSKGRPTINIAYDITEHRERLLAPETIPSAFVLLDTSEPVKWKRLSIVIFATLNDTAK